MEIFYEEIYKDHLPNIKPNIKIGQLEIPVLVVFSAVPGSGKSELTKRLINNHGFLGIANKDIRNSITRTGHENDVVIGDYTLWLLDKLAKQKNHTIVFDRNIDQWYEPAKNWATDNKYKFVVVKIEVSRDNLEKRLRRREGANVSKVLDVLDFYKNQNEQITHATQADIILEENYNLNQAAKDIVKVAMR